jgi:hypothetical protein
MSIFEKGRAKTGGRAKGVRNRLSHSFLEPLHKDFVEHGEEVIRIVRVERPHEYLKVVAYLMPKELEIIDSRLQDITDDELIAYIEYAQRQLAGRVGSVESGEESPLN